MPLGIPKQTPFEGIEEKRARTVMKLAGTLGDGESFLTSAVLERLGFCRPRAPPMPAREGNFDGEIEGGPILRVTAKKRRADSEVSLPQTFGSPGFHMFIISCNIIFLALLIFDLHHIVIYDLS